MPIAERPVARGRPRARPGDGHPRRARGDRARSRLLPARGARRPRRRGQRPGPLPGRGTARGPPRGIGRAEHRDFDWASAARSLPARLPARPLPGARLAEPRVGTHAPRVRGGPSRGARAGGAARGDRPAGRVAAAAGPRRGDLEEHRGRARLPAADRRLVGRAGAGVAAGHAIAARPPQPRAQRRGSQPVPVGGYGQPPARGHRPAWSRAERSERLPRRARASRTGCAASARRRPSPSSPSASG